VWGRFQIALWRLAGRIPGACSTSRIGNTPVSHLAFKTLNNFEQYGSGTFLECHCCSLVGIREQSCQAHGRNIGSEQSNITRRHDFTGSVDLVAPWLSRLIARVPSAAIVAVACVFDLVSVAVVIVVVAADRYCSC
jgi:hypothetical protein